jgi:hypothetical protein
MSHSQESNSVVNLYIEEHIFSCIKLQSLGHLPDHGVHILDELGKHDTWLHIELGTQICNSAIHTDGWPSIY